MISLIDKHQKLFLGRSEVLLLEVVPVMKYAKVKTISDGQIYEVCLSTLKKERDNAIPISMKWFGGGSNAE